MAVAVKNTPEVGSPSPLDRPPVAALAGTAYALCTLAVVFYLLPILWSWLGWPGAASLIVRGLVQLAALAALVVVGARLLGPRSALPGVRAGIFVGLVGFLVVLLLTRWASLWVEWLSFDRGMFGPAVGAALTAVVGLALLAGGVYLFLKPATERLLARFEGQGWFSARPYKALQGTRVRRGTIFGILLLVGAGIWTMLTHNTLRKGAPDWYLNVPFTGTVLVTDPGDVRPELDRRWPGKDYFDPAEYVKVGTPGDSAFGAGQVVPRAAFEQAVRRLKDDKKDPPTAAVPDLLVVDRYTLRDINRDVDKETHRKVIEPGASKFQTNQIVSQSEYKEEVRRLKEENETEPKDGDPDKAGGPVTYRTLTLLPSLQFTVPLLLLAAALWLAWRVVNMPAFADFLIATEAELNKVSWTTQRRLVQDTIVVLVTVVLMAFYLFSMDMVWRAVLSWKPIGVLQTHQDQQETTTPVEDRPY